MLESAKIIIGLARSKKQLEKEVFKLRKRLHKHKWISVKDKLPPFNSVVLVAFDTIDGKNYTTAQFVNQSVCLHNDVRVPAWHVHVSRGQELRTVTHWQPLDKLEVE